MLTRKATMTMFWCHWESGNIERCSPLPNSTLYIQSIEMELGMTVYLHRYLRTWSRVNIADWTHGISGPAVDETKSRSMDRTRVFGAHVRNSLKWKKAHLRGKLGKRHDWGRETLGKT